MRWKLYDPRLAGALPGFDPEAAAREGLPAKQNLVRTVVPLRIGGQEAFLKTHRARNPLARLRQRLQPKSRLEADLAAALIRRGVSAPEPLAAGWTEDGATSALLTRTVAGARSLHDAGPDLAPGERRALAGLLGCLLADLHRTHLWHADLHAGNLLLSRGPDGRPWLTVSDLPSARLLPFLPETLVLGSLAMLAASTPFFTRADALRALRAYAGGELPGPRALRRWVWRIRTERDRIWDRHWRSRTRRCTRSTGRFVTREEGGLRVVALRSLPEGAVLGAIQAHHAGKGLTVKRDRGSRVTRGLDGLCVKAFPSRGLRDALRQALGRGRARRAWISANALRERDCATAEPMAWAENGAGGYLVTEDLSGHALEMDRTVASRWGALAPPRRRRFLRDLAKTLKRLGERAAWPGDAKACNFMVREGGDGGFSFPFVDVDGVRQERPSTLRLARALSQLHLSTPRILGRLSRARLLRDLVGRRDFRAYAGLVMRLSGSARILYQSDAGDVTEDPP